jgi:glutathione S-transferase
VQGSGTILDTSSPPMALTLHEHPFAAYWDEEALPNLTRYFAALMARPSVARVVEEAREYRSLFPLPWPDWVG